MCPKTTRTLMLQRVAEEPQKESSQTESQWWNGKDKESVNRSSEKDKATLSSIPKMYSRGSKDASPRDSGSSGSRRISYLDRTNESERRKEDQDVARITQGVQNAHQAPYEGCQVRTLSGRTPGVHPKGVCSTATPARSSFTLMSIGIT